MNLELVYSIQHRLPLKLPHYSFRNFQRVKSLQLPSSECCYVGFASFKDKLKGEEPFFIGGRQQSRAFGHWCCSKVEVRLCLHRLAAFPLTFCGVRANLPVPNLANKSRQNLVF